MSSSSELLSWIPSFEGERTITVEGGRADIFLDYLFVRSAYKQAHQVASFLEKEGRLTEVRFDPRLVIPTPAATHYVSHARLKVPLDGIETISVHTRKDGR